MTHRLTTILRLFYPPMSARQVRYAVRWVEHRLDPRLVRFRPDRDGHPYAVEMEFSRADT